MKKSEEKTFLQSLELKAAKKTFGVMVGNNGETILDVFWWDKSQSRRN